MVIILNSFRKISLNIPQIRESVKGECEFRREVPSVRQTGIETSPSAMNYAWEMYCIETDDEKIQIGSRKTKVIWELSL